MPDIDKVKPNGLKVLHHWEYDGNVVKELSKDWKPTDTVYAKYITLPSTMWLGVYPQTDSSGEQLEPIKWKVLGADGGGVFLFAENVLDNKPYNVERVNTNWANSDMRKWLNDETEEGFLGKAFSKNQKDNIIVNKEIDNIACEKTMDRVFLISEAEARKYLSSYSQRVSGYTNYAQSIMYGIWKLYTNYGRCCWWIRDIDPDDTTGAITIGLDGSIYTYGDTVDKTTLGTRPAIYVSIESELLKTSNNKVTWDLNGGSFKYGSGLWASYDAYQGGQLLPATNSFIAPQGYEFAGLTINDSTTFVTEIPNDQTGDITIKVNWNEKENPRITWDLDGAQWVNGYVASTSYIEGETLVLPTADNFKARKHFTFNGWFINDDRTTNYSEIPTTQTGNVTLTANWISDISWNVKDHIYFGRYPQSSKDSSVVDPIGWTIISVDNEKKEMLLLADKVIDVLKFDKQATHSANWSISSIRDYLNFDANGFYSKAFNEKEKAAIVEKDIKYKSMRDNGSDVRVEGTAKNRLFVLDKDDIDYLKTINFDLSVYPTEYAKQHNSEEFIDNSFGWDSVNPMKSDGRISWWLSRGLQASSWAFEVDTDDSIKARTIDLIAGVRPAMYVNFAAPIFKVEESSITWDLKGGEWLDDSTWGSMITYKEGEVTKLPTADNLKNRLFNRFDGWFINDDRTATYSEIPATQTGDITLTANWIREEDAYFLNPNWFDTAVTGHNAGEVNRIYIVKYPYVGPDVNMIEKSWDIENSNGLIGYYTTGNDVYIYGGEDWPIYTAKDSTALFYRTKNATDPTQSFFKNVTDIYGLNNFDTRKTTNMTYMFMGLKNVKSIDVSSFDTSNVTSMKKMFGECDSVEEIKFGRNFDTSNVTDMSSMFEGDEKLKTLDLRYFKTPKLTTMYSMFTSCAELTTIYATKDFVTTALTSTNNVFFGCDKLVGGNDTHYSNEHNDASYAVIDGLDGKPGYFTGEYKSVK